MVEELFEKNQRLAYHVATRYTRIFPHLTEDLHQTALIGLWKAAMMFDPDRKFTFATFACKCIKNEIRMFLRKENRWMKLCAASLDAPCHIDIHKGGNIYPAEVMPDTKASIGFQDVVDSAEGSLFCRLRQKIQKKIKPLKRREKLLKIVDLLEQAGEEKVTQVELGKALGVSQSHASRLKSSLRILLEEVAS